jgi:ATP-dependent DNA helicase DinG
MQNSTSISLPDLHGVPVFYPHGTQLIWISQNGEITHPNRATIAAELALGIVLLCHRRWSSARAGVEIDHYLDVMELFAFVRPARFALPTPAGLAQQLGLARPQKGEDMATLLPQIAFTLLDELANAPDAARQEAGQIATMMTSGGWNWGPYILLHLGLPQPSRRPA